METCRIIAYNIAQPNANMSRGDAQFPTLATPARCHIIIHRAPYFPPKAHRYQKKIIRKYNEFWCQLPPLHIPSPYGTSANGQIIIPLVLEPCIPALRVRANLTIALATRVDKNQTCNATESSQILANCYPFPVAWRLSFKLSLRHKETVYDLATLICKLPGAVAWQAGVLEFSVLIISCLTLQGGQNILFFCTYFLFSFPFFFFFFGSC